MHLACALRLLPLAVVALAAPSPIIDEVTTTTTYNPAGPSVSSCHGPQRYRLQAYDSHNHTNIGHVIAAEADGNVFELIVAKTIPNDGQPYYDEFQQSAAPVDHQDFYLYLYPGGTVTPDTYLLMLYGDLSDQSNPPNIRVQSRDSGGEQFSFYFRVNIDHGKTHFSIAAYHKNHTFTYYDGYADEEANLLGYDEVGNVPNGHTPIYLAPEKSC